MRLGGSGPGKLDTSVFILPFHVVQNCDKRLVMLNRVVEL